MGVAGPPMSRVPPWVPGGPRGRREGPVTAEPSRSPQRVRRTDWTGTPGCEKVLLRAQRQGVWGLEA